MRARSRTHQSLVGLTTGLLLATGLTLATPPPASAEPLDECAASDNGSPRLDDITFTPSHVDVTEGPARVRLDVRMHDTGGPGAPTGIVEARASLRKPSPYGYETVDLEQTSDDTWTAQLTVPRGTSPGQWQVSQMWVTDGVLNDLRANASTGRDQRPFDARLTVDSPVDETEPTMTDLDLGPRRLDTRHHARDVHVSVAAEDTGSGVADVTVYARTQHSPTLSVSLEPDADGTWSGDLRIPRWRTDGTWHVKSVAVFDRSDNRRVYSDQEVAARDNPEFEVRALEDTKNPKLRGLRITPRRADVRRHGTRITYTAHLVDRQSGVASARVHGWGSLLDLHLVRGDREDGYWRASARLSPCTPIYQDNPSVLVRDRAGRLVTHTAQAPRPRHRDLNPPAVHPGEQYGLGEHGPFELTFGQPVNGIDTADAAVTRPGTAPADEAAPVIPGSWACTDRAGRPTDCVTGEVIHAAWTPDEPLAAGTSYTVVLDPEHHLGVTDLLGNPYHRKTLTFQTHSG